MSINVISSPYPVSGGGGFGPDPSTVADLEFWMDAFQETGFITGDQMSAIQDWSGNARHGTGAGALKPTYRASDGPNSLPCVRYSLNSSGDQRFTLPNFLTGFTEGHGFAVIKNEFASGTQSCVPFPDWGSSTDGYYIWPGDNNIYDTFGTNTRKNGIVPGTAVNAWHLYEVRSAAGAWSLWHNGSLVFSTASNTVGWGSAPKLGYESGPGRVLAGHVAEQCFYSAIKTGAGLTTVKDYITAKYGIALA